MTDLVDVPAQVDEVLAKLTRLYPKLIDLSLGRMRRLLGALDNPQDCLPPVIHVAGTNGKGSTIAIMRAVLEAAGYRVHVYTSPHLVRFAERIRLAGRLIDEALLLALLEHVEAANDGRPITFFEITTAVAFMAFARVPADVTLVATGMGGRFDATNVIARPLVTALSAISMDHMQYLGDTLAKIAGEKAAIMKADVPCVSVAQNAEAAAVIANTAQMIGVPLKLQNREWNLQVLEPALGLVFAGERHTWRAPAPALPGRHQFTNAGLALAALEQSGLPVPGFAVRSAMRTVAWPARAQWLRQGTLARLMPPRWELWLDGGHNADAGQVTAHVAKDLWSDRPLHLVCGMLASKLADHYMRPLSDSAASFTAVPVQAAENAYAPSELAAAASRAGMKDVHHAASITAAIARILAVETAKPGRILICGSLYLAGEALRENGEGGPV